MDTFEYAGGQWLEIPDQLAREATDNLQTILGKNGWSETPRLRLGRASGFNVLVHHRAAAGPSPGGYRFFVELWFCGALTCVFARSSPDLVGFLAHVAPIVQSNLETLHEEDIEAAAKQAEEERVKNKKPGLGAG